MKNRINYYDISYESAADGEIELLVGVFVPNNGEPANLDGVVRCFDIIEGDWLNVDGWLMNWRPLDRDDVFQHCGNLDNEMPITFDGDIIDLL